MARSNRANGRKKSSRPDGSIYDVARKAGVSIGTVSRVFNNKHDVSELTRVQVFDAAKAVRYMPRISRMRISIGLVVQQIEKANEVGFVSNAISTIAKHTALHGAVLELVPLSDIDSVYRHYLNGLIAIVFDRSYEALGAISHIPVVLINNRVEDSRFHFVGSDHAQGARLAVENLLKHGHRKIGFLEVSERDSWGSIERQRGYREAFAAAGLKSPVGLMRFCESNPARDTLVPLLDLKPTALLVCGEDLSLTVNHILIQELKINIPNQLSVVSYEIPLVSSLLSPAQTTAAQPWDDIGRMAVEGILSVVQNRDAERLDILLPNRLIERDSVKTMRVKADS